MDLTNFLSSAVAGVAAAAVTAVGLWALLRARRRERRRPVSLGQPYTASDVSTEDRVSISDEEAAGARGLYEEATRLRKAYQYDEAIRLLRRILTWDTTPAQRVAALLAIGDTFEDQGRFAEAEGHYREAEAQAIEVNLEKPLAKALGLPMAPITPTFPWLGPLGLLPYPVNYKLVYAEPIQIADRFGPEAADDPRIVSYLAKQVRRTIQQLVDTHR